MAAQLKVFAKLENLTRAPGPQGHIKSTTPSPNPEGSEPQKTPGQIKVFMKEDYSDWWPFPESKCNPYSLIYYIAYITSSNEIASQWLLENSISGHTYED